MFGRHSVRMTYAHKRRRVQNGSKKSLSSPLEVLPPETEDLTHTQMARRMLKRSRRVALAEQFEDKNVEHISEHLAKRIKHNEERSSKAEPAGAPFDMSLQDDISFQTPFSALPSAHESAVTKPRVPEQLSPVPAAKRVQVSRTSSRNLKENSTHSQTLASPFRSRPGSAVPSPKHNGRGRPRRSLHAKSRTLSGVFKENARQVSRQNSTASLNGTNRETRAGYIKHHRYPSSPSTSYMRSQLSSEDWIVPPKALSRMFDDCDATTSPGSSVHSDASFYTGQPQSCSTPAISRLGKAPDLRGREARISGSLTHTEAGELDVEMIDETVPSRRRTIHLSGNSIFSSSGEFTIGSLPATNNGAAIVDGNDVTNQDKELARVAHQVSVRRKVVQDSQADHPSAGSFIAEYDIPLSDMTYSPVSTTATKILGPEDAPKLSVGEQLFSLPGTSPVHGRALVLRTCRKAATLTPPASPSECMNPEGVPKLFVEERSFSLPRTSPAHGGTLIIRTCRKAGALTPPASPRETTAPCPPSSPASDLAQEFGSMDICGDLDTHSDRETRHPPAPKPLLPRASSLQNAVALAESATKKSVKRMPARNRAGTIRASDFVKPVPGASSPNNAPGQAVSLLSNMRRTRSGTVVGPDSKLATKSTGTKGGPATRLAPVLPGRESESDDELLLKAAWIEDMEYLGLAVPLDKDAEADELNLGGMWTGPARRLGLRRR